MFPFLNKEDRASFLTRNGTAQTIGEVSDGYHTFNELYDHRCVLFMVAMRALRNYCDENKATVVDTVYPWISKKHHDGSEWDGWFIAGMPIESGDKIVQVTYHLPMKYWDKACKCAIQIGNAPEWDGHTSQDVLQRLLDVIP